jgi:hypothetical protein
MNNYYELIISIILGYVIGIIIGYILFKKYKYIGPNSNDICKKIYIDNNGKKYKYTTTVCICPVDYSMNNLHDPNFRENHD